MYQNFKIFRQRRIRPRAENISKRKEELEWGLDDIRKGGYSHFMLKEIFDQLKSILNSFRGRIIKKEMSVKLEGLENIKEHLKNINRLKITGCGTAYLSGWHSLRSRTCFRTALQKYYS